MAESAGAPLIFTEGSLEFLYFTELLAVGVLKEVTRSTDDRISALCSYTGVKLANQLVELGGFQYSSEIARSQLPPSTVTGGAINKDDLQSFGESLKKLVTITRLSFLTSFSLSRPYYRHSVSRTCTIFFTPSHISR